MHRTIYEKIFLTTFLSSYIKLLEKQHASHSDHINLLIFMSVLQPPDEELQNYVKIQSLSTTTKIS